MSPAFLICASIFLLTPLREGRRGRRSGISCSFAFLLTPLREGRRMQGTPQAELPDFYSRPCGRGDPGGKV